MASISTGANGRRRCLFVLGGERKVVRLGDVPRKYAEAFRTRVEEILAARGLGRPLEADTAEWVGKLDDTLHGRLAATGLIEPRQPAAPGPTDTLSAFVTAYLAKRTDLKPGTVTNIRYAAGYLAGYFGEGKPLADVTEGDAEDFRLHLRGPGCGLGDNTARKVCSRARQIFAAAVKRRLIPSNPFGSLKGLSVTGRSDRHHFVSHADAAKLLDACPDLQWRLIVALARYGGLRTPSEVFALRWEDVDWSRGRFRVRVPKLEHHEGKGERVVPLFPELRVVLDEAFAALPERGSPYVITRYRDVRQNLRTTFGKIIRRAGLTPWSRLFQNLRSSRQTELAETYPAHVVCAWLGNSEAIASRHYLQVTDAHFQSAVVREGDAQSDARHGGTRGQGVYRSDRHVNGNDSESAAKGRKPRNEDGESVFPTGFEPPLKSRRKTQERERGDAQSGAPPPGLERIWPKLTPAERAVILGRLEPLPPER